MKTTLGKSESAWAGQGLGSKQVCVSPNIFTEFVGEIMEMACMWFVEMCSRSRLTILPVLAWVLLNYVLHFISIWCKYQTS